MTIGPPPSPGPRLTSASYAPAGLLRGCCFPPPSFSASPAAPASPTGTSSFLPQPRLPRVEKPPSSPRRLARARPPPTVPPQQEDPYRGPKSLPPLPPQTLASQQLSLELLPSFHFRAVHSPEPPFPCFRAPRPISGEPFAVFTPPTCTSGPPLSLFLDALQAPKTTSGPLPPPAGLPQTRTPYPGSA